jgi:site-specific DNA-methyltransferase (adenine-specific)
MEKREKDSIHAIVTDPPYGLKEYTTVEKEKLRNGNGGVWRIPPSFDGCKRRPLPRFTVLTESERSKLKNFFSEFARRAIRVLVPGGHLFVATNPLLSHLVYLPLIEAGFEKRGEIIRLVKTLRGGGPPEERSRGVCSRHGDAALGLGAVGAIPQAVRGSSSGQSPQIENGRPAAGFA